MSLTKDELWEIEWTQKILAEYGEKSKAYARRLREKERPLSKTETFLLDEFLSNNAEFLSMTSKVLSTLTPTPEPENKRILFYLLMFCFRNPLILLRKRNTLYYLLGNSSLVETSCRGLRQLLLRPGQQVHRDDEHEAQADE